MGKGDRLASPQAPFRGVGDRHDSLLYHSENNSDKSNDTKSRKLSNQQAKKMKALDENCKHFVKKLGLEHLGFLTLTFKENLKCHKESQKRWNNLNRLISREGKFEVLVKVKEYQKRGAIHYHMLIKSHKPIRGKIDWDIYEQMGKATDLKEKRRLGKELAKTAEPHLVELWGWLRKKCKSTGFGRSEVMPIKKAEHTKNYMGKYLEKDMENNKGSALGMRMITYGQKNTKVANTQFSWVNGKSSAFRLRLKQFAEARGIKDQEEMAEIFGKSWSYHLYKHVLFDRVTAEYNNQAFQELFDPTNNKQKMVWPWKGTIVSGVWSEKTKEKVMDQYFKEDEVKRTNLRNHREHNGKWIKAEKARKLHERIYG
jgi:hypothetical protein